MRNRITFKMRLAAALAKSEEDEKTQTIYWPARRLTVQILAIQPPDKTVLRIWHPHRHDRRGLPTLAQWQAVLDALPYAVDCAPKPMHIFSRRMLIGSWLTPDDAWRFQHQTQGWLWQGNRR